MALKIPISFAESEKYLYDYVKSKRNYSAYIKDLVEEDMRKSGVQYNKECVNKQIEAENDLGLDF